MVDHLGSCDLVKDLIHVICIFVWDLAIKGDRVYL